MFFDRMPLGSAANFCRRFGTGLRAGLDVLRLLQGEAKHGSERQRAAMQQLRQAIAAGEPLHVAMQQQGRYFPPLLIAMVHAGELTGKLDQTLLTLAEHFEQRVRLRRDFLRRISWPMLQLFLAVNILAILIYLLGVLSPPTGGQMFDPTGFGLRGAGGALRFYGYVLSVVAVIAAAIIGFQKNFAGVHNLIPLLYRIPLAGPALQTITLSRFTWTLALSLEAGIDPIRAIHLGLDATDSDFYRTGKEEVVQAIRSGKTMSETLQSTDLFPEDFVTAIEVAELSGTDAEAMHHLAADYDQRAKGAVQTLAGLASGIVWAGFIIVMVSLILRMLFRISGGIQDVLQPL